MQGAKQPRGQEARPGLVSKLRTKAGCRGPRARPEGAPATRERSPSKEEQCVELRDTSHPAVSPCGGPGTLEQRWAKPRDEGWSAERLGPCSLARHSPRWDRQSGRTGRTQAVPQESSASAPMDEDTGNVSDLVSRLCPLPFEYSVGLPLFQGKPVPHTALRTFGAHTTSNPKFTPDPQESGPPCSQARGTEGPASQSPRPAG